MRFGVQNSVIVWGMHQKQINVLCLMISKKRLWQKKKGRISTLEILIILFYHKSLSQVALWRTGTRAEILGLGSRSLFLHIIIFIGLPSWRSFFVSIDLQTGWHWLRQSTAKANSTRPPAKRYAATTSTARSECYLHIRLFAVVINSQRCFQADGWNPLFSWQR